MQNIKKPSHYRNYCIDSNQILHSNKTTKYSLKGGLNMVPRWQMAAILQKFDKSPYLSNGLTDCHKICHDNTEWPYWLLKISNF